MTLKNLRQKIACKGLALATAGILCAPGASTQVINYQTMGSLSDLSFAKQQQAIAEARPILKKFKKKELTPGDVAVGLTWLKIRDKDPTDPENVSISDIRSYLQEELYKEGSSTFEHHKWSWGTTPADPETKEGRTYLQYAQIRDAFTEVQQRIHEEFLAEPEEGCYNAIRTAITEVKPLEDINLTFFEWDSFPWEERTYEATKGADNNQQAGETEMFLFLHTEEAIKEAKRLKNEQEIFYKGTKRESRRFIAEEDVKASAVTYICQDVTRSPTLRTLIEDAAAEDKVPASELSYVLSGKGDYIHIRTELPAVPVQIVKELPFIKEEEIAEEEDESLDDLVKKSLDEQRKKQAKQNNMRAAIVLPNELLWNHRVIDAMNNAVASEHYEEYKQTQETAIDSLLEDETFYASLPDTFWFVGLGCGDATYEAKIINALQEKGKEIVGVSIIDLDITANAEAVENLSSETGHTVVNYQGDIKKESLEQLSKELDSQVIAPKVYFGQGIVNFDGHRNHESAFYQSIVAALKEDDRAVIAKKLMTEEESPDLYKPSEEIGKRMLEVVGLKPKSWVWEGVTKDVQEKEYRASFRAKENDGEFLTNSQITYLKSSRKPMHLLVDKDKHMTYRSADAEEIGYEVSVLRNTVN